MGKVIRVILFVLLFTPGFQSMARASEACEQCMAECPHLTKDLKACDVGCPKVCTRARVAAIGRVHGCETCLNQCPHDSRDFKPCDGGCVKECDRSSLLELWKKGQVDLKQCRSGNQNPSAGTAEAN